MIEEFLEHIHLQNLLNKQDKALLTVSGGIDSMTLLDLFMHTDYKFAIAHCNFKLRGKESDNDQIFVRNYAKKNNIRFFTIEFETEKYTKDNKISVQMAARELRYKWFDDIARENGYSKIATAHNLNDVAETFFINLTRSTGLKGLTGIPAVNGNIIRPLLFATRKKIIEYAKQHHINYREDSTNAATKYLRNAIRHKVIPALEEISPAFLNSLSYTTKLLSAAHNLYNEKLISIKKQLIEEYANGVKIDIQKIKKHIDSPEILYEILSEYDFSLDTAGKLLNVLDNQPGLTFKSGKYLMIKDRKYIIITKLNSLEKREFIIRNESDVNNLPIKLNITRQPFNGFENINKSKQVATFDSERIQFPLILRRWKDGDYFYPFGMKGRKKISDFLTDLKLPVHEKDMIWLLISGKEIIWVINHRTDNRYRVTENTKEIIQIETIG